MTTTHDIHLRRADLPSFVRFPDEPGYGELVRPWSPTADQRPAFVAAPRTTAEVSEAVQLAVGRELRVAVQGTGHGASGSLDDEVALIATRYLDTLQIDRRTDTATVGAGTVGARSLRRRARLAWRGWPALPRRSVCAVTCWEAGWAGSGVDMGWPARA
jgi:hypothetical protein